MHKYELLDHALKVRMEVDVKRVAATAQRKSTFLWMKENVRTKVQTRVGAAYDFHGSLANNDKIEVVRKSCIVKDLRVNVRDGKFSGNVGIAETVIKSEICRCTENNREDEEKGNEDRES